MEVYKDARSGKKLHIVIRQSDFRKQTRLDVVEPDQFLQCAILQFQSETGFRAHKHIEKSGPSACVAQESWVVIAGAVQCTFYDLEDKVIAQPILYPGDASITLYGGHTYRTLQPNTLVYEFKTGPYHGQALDKEFL